MEGDVSKGMHMSSNQLHAYMVECFNKEMCYLEAVMPLISVL